MEERGGTRSFLREQSRKGTKRAEKRVVIKRKGQYFLEEAESSPAFKKKEDGGGERGFGETKKRGWLPNTGEGEKGILRREEEPLLSRKEYLPSKIKQENFATFWGGWRGIPGVKCLGGGPASPRTNRLGRRLWKRKGENARSNRSF